MSSITMKALLETGVHFGHRTRKWNPKMKPYIFTERNGIHILDLHQTLKAVKDCCDMVRDRVAEGGSVLFVGTKRQAQDTIAREAMRCGMPYVSERWLGGMLTNWRTMRQRIDYLKELEARRDRGEFELLTKKEGLILTRQIENLNARLGGIREMRGLPSYVFVVDVRREHTAVHEANILTIPVIAMVDTNCDPEMIDHVIPANDDAIRAIKLVAGVMADAVLEGVTLRKDSGIEEPKVEELPEGYDYAAEEAQGEEPIEADEALLGEATLAKLKSGTLAFEDEAAEAEKPETEAAPMVEEFVEAAEGAEATDAEAPVESLVEESTEASEPEKMEMVEEVEAAVEPLVEESAESSEAEPPAESEA